MFYLCSITVLLLLSAPTALLLHTALKPLLFLLLHLQLRLHLPQLVCVGFAQSLQLLIPEDEKQKRRSGQTLVHYSREQRCVCVCVSVVVVVVVTHTHTHQTMQYRFNPLCAVYLITEQTSFIFM